MDHLKERYEFLKMCPYRTSTFDIFKTKNDIDFRLRILLKVLEIYPLPNYQYKSRDHDLESWFQGRGGYKISVPLKTIEHVFQGFSKFAAVTEKKSNGNYFNEHPVHKLYQDASFRGI